ncbi:unnamed protein product [Penicillium salamii]|uniref:Zn(2)-C6 fungal-type domain-containing protein n=1 Tax=Penicillium salamii TaxID=1612424 RepID=A0A9W4IKY9_9EURO|nr:unnamed protein product [Penicillium salamii]CAG8005181.1 unnamed protein product [Penicillium salamii]CAG8216475.1 unnamed protein product [Penicillium salamii]CAG8299415.1 unnamed protein product [Penicillium salamii]CAG8326045.1 unnamed protein product [Penicillium salamii]
MNAPSHDEVDRVLRLKRKEREVRACYPCRKRKVKCDGTQPCRTCQKRNHPHICTYDLPPDSRKEASHPAVNVQSASPSPGRVQRSRRQNEFPAAPLANIPLANIPTSHRLDDTAKNYVYSGDNSVVSILRSRASDGNESMTQDLGSVLGLQNTFNNYPFMDSKTPQEKWKSLLSVLPQRSEVLKFFHYYRVTAYPFNPILADMDRFESDMCTYLNAHSAGELRDEDQIVERWASDKSVGHISLLLATLAAGAHYSDIDYPARLELATDFARRSFHALRLSNFLFRPSLDIVQTLLILGNTLQNMGQSDAAWALLGTTIRLAQTMGLHTERSTSQWPEYVRTKSRTLWSTIVWQDSLLCMCYDRPPIVTVTGWTRDNSLFRRTDLSYQEIMHSLCRLILDIIRPDTFVGEFDRAIEALNRLDTLYQRGQPHLQMRSNCTTLQQNLEHLALKMHSSFCVSVVCRPAMKQSHAQPHLLQPEILRNRAKGSLIDASRAFLDFQALSVVPMRSWSMVHTVLSSTLLLCIWEETRNDPQCRDLQQSVIDVFSSSDSRTAEEGGIENDGQWLSARHIRALVTLRGALDRQQESNMPENEPWMPQNLDAGGFGQSIPDGLFDDINPFENSPVSYLDMIMNGPMFDLSQESNFL